MKYLIILMILCSSVLGQNKIKIAVNNNATIEEMKIIKKIKSSFDGVETINLNLRECFKAVREGEADMALGHITITLQRERDFDFGVPYKDSSLKILQREEIGSWEMLINVSSKLMKPLAILFGAMLLGGLIVWLAERGSEETFTNDWSGYCNAIYFTFVTFVTLGYGDFTCKTPYGKMASVLVALCGISLYGFCVSQATSALSQMSVKELKLEDFKDINIATVRGTTSAEFLRDEGISFQESLKVEHAVQALQRKEVDAVLFDGCILEKYRKGLSLSKTSYKAQQYGIIFRNNSHLRDKIHEVLEK